MIHIISSPHIQLHQLLDAIPPSWLAVQSSHSCGGVLAGDQRSSLAGLRPQEFYKNLKPIAQHHDHYVWGPGKEGVAAKDENVKASYEARGEKIEPLGVLRDPSKV